jgi:hypothetical protein
MKSLSTEEEGEERKGRDERESKILHLNLEGKILEFI